MTNGPDFEFEISLKLGYKPKLVLRGWKLAITLVVLPVVGVTITTIGLLLAIPIANLLGWTLPVQIQEPTPTPSAEMRTAPELSVSTYVKTAADEYRFQLLTRQITLITPVDWISRDSYLKVRQLGLTEDQIRALEPTYKTTNWSLKFELEQPLSKPVTLYFPYEPRDLEEIGMPRPENLSVLEWQPEQRTWTNLPTQFVPGTPYMQLELTNLSQLVLAWQRAGR